MSQILKLTHENQQLKRQVSQYKQVLGISPFIDDSTLKGGYRVVKTITDRDKIDCCHRKQGMKVIVVGEDLSFKEYILKTDNCKENTWEEISVTVEENEVFLIEDYSELSEDLITQRDLNLVLKQLVLNLQTQIDNIELIDEKVQITENTGFAQIGQNQKDFNRNVANTVSNQGNEINILKGINFEMDIPNQKLILRNGNSVILTEISVAFLNDEAKHLEYDGAGNLVLKNEQDEILSTLSVASFINQIGKSLNLDGYQLELLDENNNILSTVIFEISSILGLQTALDSKLTVPIMTNDYYGLWDDTNKKFITGSIYKNGSNTYISDKLFTPNGVNTKNLSFTLQSSITPTPNTLVPKIDGSGLIWYNNNSVEKQIPNFPSTWQYTNGGGNISSNTAYGEYTLSVNSTGVQNTAFGYNALKNNNGNYNTSFGNSALISNTTGYGNTAIGVSALNNNTTGYNNTAIGLQTMYWNVSGYNNVGVGNDSLRSATGNNNTGLGVASLRGTAGNNNVAVGVSAMYAGGGSNNTAVGYTALQSCTTGNNNTAIGIASLYSNTTGGTNIGIGDSSVKGNTTGSNNVSVGASLYFHTTPNRYTMIGSGTIFWRVVTGNDNIGIGYNVGNSDLATGSYLTSLDNSLLVGNNTKPLNNNDTNEIIIGNNASGNGSNTATIGDNNINTLHLMKNGAGIVLKSPDGTKKIKISIDNTGNLITTLI